jgi:tetratricopeptide (TPR) repeat protein
MDAMSKRLSMLDEMIAKGATDPFVHYARAMELRSLGRREEALEAFAALVASIPAYVPTYLMAGQLATELGRRDEARSFLARGIEQARASGEGKALSELSAALDELEEL